MLVLSFLMYSQYKRLYDENVFFNLLDGNSGLGSSSALNHQIDFD